MDQIKLRRLLELIEEVATSSQGSWQDRKAELLAEATDSEKTAIDEFVGWFNDAE